MLQLGFMTRKPSEKANMLPLALGVKVVLCAQSSELHFECLDRAGALRCPFRRLRDDRLSSRVGVVRHHALELLARAWVEVSAVLRDVGARAHLS